MDCLVRSMLPQKVGYPDAMWTKTAALTLLGSVCVISACSDAPAPPPPPAASAPAPAPAANAPLTFVPIAGNWTTTTDSGQPTITADGTKPSSGSAAPLVQALFGADTDAFLKRTTGADAFPLAVVREVAAFTNGRLTMQFKLIGGKSDQLAGLVFNLKPDGSYNFARYNTKDGNVALWQFVNGDRQRILEGPDHVQLPLGTWHELKVEVRGAKVVASVNDKLRLEHTLPAPVAGRVGFWTKRDSVTAFKGFSVR
jgi:hypothetical protein